MICYVLAMGKQHLGPYVVVGYGIKIFWPGLFITPPDHLESVAKEISKPSFLLAPEVQWASKFTLFVRFTFPLNVSNHAHIWYVT